MSMRNDDRTGDETPATEIHARPIVYVRRIGAEDLPADVAAKLPDATAERPIYAVSDDAGRALAYFGDRELAFASARQHEMQPVSVH